MLNLNLAFLLQQLIYIYATNDHSSQNIYNAKEILKIKFEINLIFTHIENIITTS